MENNIDIDNEKNEQKEELSSQLLSLKLPSFFHPVDESFIKSVELKEAFLSCGNDFEYKELSKWFTENENLINYRTSIEPIESRFINSTENLDNGSIVICVYGNVNAGKSTLCNLLVGAEKGLLTVSNAPCTAVPTVVCSSPFTNSGKVYFSPGDFSAIIDKIEERKPKLLEMEGWVKCKELLLSLSKSKVPGEDFAILDDLKTNLHLVSSLSIDLRREKVLGRLEFDCPIMGISEKGIRLVDCPGIMESDILTFLAQRSAQSSTIILYVLNTLTSMTKEDIRFLTNQCENGCEVIFLFNRRIDDEENFISQKIYDIENILSKGSNSPFKKHKIYQIDFLSKLNNRMKENHPLKYQFFEDNFTDFLKHLSNVFRDRNIGMTFQYSAAFYQLLKTQYLVSSHFISAIMGNSNDQEEKGYIKMVNTIKNDINSLEKLGTNLISKYKLDVAELYKKKLQSLEMPILMQSRDFPVEAEYSPPPSSGGNIQHFFGSAFAHNFETVFEEQLAQGLISFFTNLFSRELTDWISKVRIEFVKEILNKANKIEEQTNILREQATSSDITFQMGEVFKDTEIQIRGLALAQIAMAGPVIGVVLGGGLGLPLLFFGAVATSFLAGGVIIIAGVAVAVVASLVALGRFKKSVTLTEGETRTQVGKSVNDFLRNFPYTNKPEFLRLVNDAVSPCELILKYILSTLRISIIQVEGLTKKLDKLKIKISEKRGYEELCKFLYFREKLEQKIVELKEYLTNLNEYGPAASSSSILYNLAAQINSSISKNRKNKIILFNKGTKNFGYQAPHCYICSSEFSHCNHICPSCRYYLQVKENSPACPACYRPISFSKDFNLLFKISDFSVENIPLIDENNIGKDNGEAVFYFDEKVRVKALLKPYLFLVDKYIEWFTTSYNSSLLNLITAKESLSVFINSFIQKIASEELPDYFRSIVTDCLHDLIFPEIYDSFFGLYKIHYYIQDQNIHQAINTLKEKPPTYFLGEESKLQKANWLTSDRFLPAVEKLKLISNEKIPLNVVKIIVEFYAIFEEQVVPPDAKGLKNRGADDLIPFLIYLLVQTQIDHLYSLFEYVNDNLENTNLIKYGSKEEYAFVGPYSLVVNNLFRKFIKN